jgi:hypothetical protein
MRLILTHIFCNCVAWKYTYLTACIWTPLNCREVPKLPWPPTRTAGRCYACCHGMWFQHIGAPPHFARCVTQFLKPVVWRLLVWWQRAASLIVKVASHYVFVFSLMGAYKNPFLCNKITVSGRVIRPHHPCGSADQKWQDHASHTHTGCLVTFIVQI